MYVRHYTLSASAGANENLRASLERLAKDVRAVPGNLGVHLFRDVENKNQFIFIEQWKSADAHKSGAKLLPKATLADLMSNLDSPPVARNLTSLLTDIVG